MKDSLQIHLGPRIQVLTSLRSGEDSEFGTGLVLVVLEEQFDEWNDRHDFEAIVVVTQRISAGKGSFPVSARVPAHSREHWEIPEIGVMLSIPVECLPSSVCDDRLQ